MTSEVNDDKAYALLALAMARAAHGWAQPADKHGISSGQMPADHLVFYHDHMSSLENIADALTRLGIIRKFENWECLFIFTCEMTAVPNLAVENRSQGPGFHEMLHYFCYHFSDFSAEYYGLDFHIDTSFCPQHGMCEVVDALAELGYAHRLGVDSVGRLKNPAQSIINSEKWTTAQVAESGGDKIGSLHKNESEGTPCFVWTERMHAIPANGMVWDVLQRPDSPDS
ncbi:hypothetical protein V6R98_28285 [Agrobacterium sp. CCNWLW71]|uniref:hypothetical protein n=1 Tax=unclassified Agrobacterium TaxID=2632611 RepID=UPI000DD34534